MKKGSIVLTAIFSVLFMLAGCQNTMEGFGKDLQQNGKEIQKSASSDK